MKLTKISILVLTLVFALPSSALGLTFTMFDAQMKSAIDEGNAGKVEELLTSSHLNNDIAAKYADRAFLSRNNYKIAEKFLNSFDIDMNHKANSNEPARKVRWFKHSLNLFYGAGGELARKLHVEPLIEITKRFGSTAHLWAAVVGDCHKKRVRGMLRHQGDHLYEVALNICKSSREVCKFPDFDIQQVQCQSGDCQSKIAFNPHGYYFKVASKKGDHDIVKSVPPTPSEYKDLEGAFWAKDQNINYQFGGSFENLHLQSQRCLRLSRKASRDYSELREIWNSNNSDGVDSGESSGLAQ